MHLFLCLTELVCHDVCKNYICRVVMHSGIVSLLVSLSESVFRKSCPIGVLVVGKSTSVLLQSIMLYVDCGDDGLVV